VLLSLLAISVTVSGVVAGPVRVWTDRSVYYIGEPVTVYFSTDNPGRRGIAEISVRGPAGSVYTDTKKVDTGKEYFFFIPAGVLSIAGPYDAMVMVNLQASGYGVMEGSTTFTVKKGSPPFDFSLSITPSTATVKAGETARFSIEVVYGSPSDSDAQISFDVTGLGTGMDWQLTEGNSFIISTRPTIASGTYTFSVTGRVKEVTRSASGTLIVEKPSEITMHTVSEVTKTVSVTSIITEKTESSEIAGAYGPVASVGNPLANIYVILIFPFLVLIPSILLLMNRRKRRFLQTVQIRCPKCNYVNKIGNDHCKNCGIPLRDETRLWDESTRTR